MVDKQQHDLVDGKARFDLRQRGCLSSAPFYAFIMVVSY